MFRALYTHHQEAELYWCSIWYHHSLIFRVTIPNATPIQCSFLMMSI